jgi:hypothetical protein
MMELYVYTLYHSLVVTIIYILYAVLPEEGLLIDNKLHAVELLMIMTMSFKLICLLHYQIFPCY